MIWYFRVACELFASSMCFVFEGQYIFFGMRTRIPSIMYSLGGFEQIMRVFENKIQNVFFFKSICSANVKTYMVENTH